MLREFTRSRSLLLVAVVIGLLGCEKERDFGARVKTYPVVGKVTVDGQPAANLQVVAHSTAPPKKAETNPDGTPKTKIYVPAMLSAFTDKDGHFEISTYKKGDGIPAGEYTLTFLWGQYNLMSAKYGGPDKLKGKYKDPKKSEIKFTTDPTKPTDLGTINLTIGSDDAKKK